MSITGKIIIKYANLCILKEISPGISLERMTLKLKLQYFGHLMQRVDSLEKYSDAGRDWGQEEEGTTEDEMAGWHHWLNGRESEWTPGVGDGQGGLACCDSWGRKESDTTERMNWTELNWMIRSWIFEKNFFPEMKLMLFCYISWSSVVIPASSDMVRVLGELEKNVTEWVQFSNLMRILVRCYTSWDQVLWIITCGIMQPLAWRHRPPWAWENLHRVQSATFGATLEATLDREAIFYHLTGVGGIILIAKKLHFHCKAIQVIADS